MNTLLEDIKLSIKQAGGRIKLAYLLMKENPYAFTYAEKMDMNNRLSKQIHWDTHGHKKRPHTGAWDKEEDEYLLKYWGKKSSATVSKHLNRTVIVCNRRIQKLLTKEEYKARVPQWRNKVSKTSFKKAA